MIDKNDPEIQRYLEEELQKQKEQIAERILWEKVDFPFYDSVCEAVARYTGLSQEKTEEIAKKCSWKVDYINGCAAAKLMDTVKNFRDFLENVEKKEYVSNGIDRKTYIKEVAKFYTVEPSSLDIWRKDPNKYAVMELSKHGICDTFIMVKLGITREQVEKLKPTYEELEAYHPAFKEKMPSEEEAEEKYQQALRETEKEEQDNRNKQRFIEHLKMWFPQ